MASIEDRVVSLKFENGQFQKAVSTTLQQLSVLKSSLAEKLRGTSFEGLADSARKIDLSPLSSGVQTASEQLSNLKVVGVAALAAIGAKAASVGMQIGKNFLNNAFINNPKAGFEEYELNIDSIQTIMANTGRPLKDVNKSLDQLNKYADETIYNFADMTKNIGLFTNAGIGLEDATSMIKGFSNEAAVSGTNATGAAGAAYQLSQALSAGVITLMDWKSLSNVGMGNANMRKGIIQIADAMGAFKGSTITAKDATEDFNGTLEKKWLTADVMQNYLKIQAGELSKEQMKSIGLTDKQIDRFIKQQGVAQDSAQKIRTFSKLMGTISEVAGSGWTQTMQLIIGDFDEATELFSSLGDTIIDGFIQPSADARNAMLKMWKDMGGREALINGFINIWKALGAVLAPVKKAFATVFGEKDGGAKGKVLANLSKAFEAFTKSLIIGKSTIELITQVFTFLFNIIKIGGMILGGIVLVIAKVFTALFKANEGAGLFSQGLSEMLKNVNKALKDTRWISQLFEAIGRVAAKAASGLRLVAGGIVSLVSSSGLVKFLADAFTYAAKAIASMADGFSKGLGSFLSGSLNTVLTRVTERLKMAGDLGEKLKSLFKSIAKSLAPLGVALGEMFAEIANNLTDVFTNVNFDQGLDILNTGLLAGLVLLVRNFFKNITGMGDGAIKSLKDGLMGSLDGLVGSVSKTFSALTDTLSAMQDNLNSKTLINIAIAIGVLTASLVVLSLIDSKKLTSALIAMGVMFVQLGYSMKAFEAANLTTNVAKMLGLGAALVLFAISITVLASAVKKLSKLDMQDLGKGLGGILVLLIAMAKIMPTLSANAANLIATGLGLVAIAVAIRILASAVSAFAKLDFGQMVKGLVGVGATLAALTLFTKFAKVEKGSFATGAGLLLLAVAIKIIASAVSEFATLNVGEIVKGLVVLGGVTLALQKFTKATSGSKGMITTATGMVILAAAMKIMASAISDMGSIPLGDLVKGLLAMALALGTITIAMNLLPGASMLASSVGLVIVAAALKILASVMQDLGSMSWVEIAKSFVLLASSLIVLSGAMILMNGTIAGAAALTVVVLALALFLPVLKGLASLSWGEVLIGLVTLAGALTLIGLAGLVLTPVVPTLLILGAAVALLGVGLMGVGAGMLAFAGGLILLATISGTTFPVIIAMVKQFLALIPYAMEQLGLGLVAFTDTIVANIPVFLEAMTALISTLLQAIITLAPQIAEALMVVIVNLLSLLQNAVPLMIQVAMELIVGIITGISNKIGDVVAAAVNLIVNFLNGLASKLGDIIAAGVNLVVKFLEGVGQAGNDIINAAFDMIIKFVNGLTQTVNDKIPELQSAARGLAFAIVDGVTGGLASKARDALAAVGDFGSQMLDKFKGILRINSPSKAFRDIAHSIPEGVSVGIDNKSDMATRSATKLGESAMDGMRKSIANASKIPLDPNMRPTIRPVLDLSDVKKNASGIPGMLGDHSIGSVTTAQAKGTARDEDAFSKTSGQTNQNESSVKEVNFYQTNNSPKSLSTAEIYRNTNNQISRAKELIDAK